ncbi:hypothetical protein [Trinickia mobilis]|uniref:hypothetical protein n=1 Tax=Trinickia mobilis TaxID=2816356 RepID=UPI001A8C299E|nr:hypothetical protein [Trinickia mobilis]
MKFPRGLAESAIGHIYLASGIDPQTGEGQNTILRFREDGSLVTTFNVVDAGLSPTDTEVGPNGDLFSGSEFPFNSPHAMATVREYDGRTGTLKRVFDVGVDADGRRVRQKPHGITFAPTEAFTRPD